MNDITAAASRHIPAPPDRIYDVFADYVEKHPRILPEEFSDYRLEAGGRGAGTVISVTVTLQGGARQMRMAVSEPEPGRVMVETDEARKTVTRFTVDPSEGGSTVTIDTRFPRSGRLRGLIESLFAPRMLRALYAKELGRVAEYLRV
jgi:hypothetical protein